MCIHISYISQSWATKLLYVEDDDDDDYDVSM